jgi:hypothetical protein
MEEGATEANDRSRKADYGRYDGEFVCCSKGSGTGRRLKPRVVLCLTRSSLSRCHNRSELSTLNLPEANGGRRYVIILSLKSGLERQMYPTRITTSSSKSPIFNNSKVALSKYEQEFCQVRIIVGNSTVVSAPSLAYTGNQPSG